MSGSNEKKADQYNSMVVFQHTQIDTHAFSPPKEKKKKKKKVTTSC